MARARATEMAAGHILELNPFRCKVWELHDRLVDYVTDESCKAEIESISATGQLVPVLGRPLTGDLDFDVELIYGARRLFVAQYLNVPLRVEVREMSDREAIVAMDTENRHRKDICPYERGLSFARWLQKGYFNSQDEIARALRISASQVSRVLRLAKLPAVIVSAFRNPSDIREGWGLDLLQLWEDDRTRDLIAQRARNIAKRVPSLGAEEVYRYLTAPAGSVSKERKMVRDIVVRASNGSPMFRVRQLQNSLALLLPLLSEVTMSRICEAVSEVLRNGGSN
jgi:ParB family chromosome partitioning protein